jgi:hypothetical protein
MKKTPALTGASLSNNRLNNSQTEINQFFDAHLDKHACKKQAQFE